MPRPLKSNQSAPIDQLARSVFDLAVVAALKQDAELALDVCARLRDIEPEYELRLKGAEVFRPLLNFRGVPSRTTREHFCALCGQKIYRNWRVLVDKRRKAVAHLQCPSDDF